MGGRSGGLKEHEDRARGLQGGARSGTNGRAGSLGGHDGSGDSPLVPWQIQGLEWPWQIRGFRGPWRVAPPKKILGKSTTSGGRSGGAGFCGWSGGAGTWGRSGSADAWGHSGRADSRGRSGSAFSRGRSGSTESRGRSGSADTWGRTGSADTWGRSGSMDPRGRSGELVGASRGSEELVGTSRGSRELDGTSRGSGELDGISRGTGEHLRGAGTGGHLRRASTRGCWRGAGYGAGLPHIPSYATSKPRGTWASVGGIAVAGMLACAANGGGLTMAVNGSRLPVNGGLGEPRTAAKVSRERRTRMIRKLVIHWQMEVETENCGSLFWRVSGMMVYYIT